MRRLWLVGALGLLAAGSPVLAETAEEFQAKLSFRQGDVAVGDGLATFKLTPAFRYLDADQTERVLRAWGNPPGARTLGMVLPSDIGPMEDGSWAVVISYDEDGFVDDKGAEKIDYDELLRQMQKETKDANQERAKAGFEPVELVGWAEPPHYDRAAHKLYWAKQLKFGAAESDSLNYNIRVLGRRGVLVLNAVAGVDQLSQVRDAMQSLIPVVEFNEGHRYADYLPGKDKLAEYGVGALIVGSLAAKTGLFKGLIAMLLASKKLLIIGLAAAAAAVKKFFGKGSQQAT